MRAIALRLLRSTTLPDAGRVLDAGLLRTALLVAQLAYLAGVVALVSGPGDVIRVPLIRFAGDLPAAILLLSLLFGGGIPRPALARGMSLLCQSASTGGIRGLREFRRESRPATKVSVRAMRSA